MPIILCGNKCDIPHNNDHQNAIMVYDNVTHIQMSVKQQDNLLTPFLLLARLV